MFKYLPRPGIIGSKALRAEDTHDMAVWHLSPCSHLQINVSDPLDDAMRCPNQRIHILVLTLYPTGLQGLEVKYVDITLKSSLTSRPVVSCGWHSFWPPCRTGAVAAVRFPAAGWSGGTSWWCWGGVQGHGGSVSSACARLPGDCGRPGSTGAGPRHLTRPWPPSGDPDLQPWTTCRQKKHHHQLTKKKNKLNNFFFFKM